VRSGGWLWQLISAAELIDGLALLSVGYAPLGLAVLAPVTAGIFAVAVKTGGEETSVGILLAAAHLYLTWQYRSSLQPLLQRHETARSEHGRQ
jgi:hypothetical protein